MNPLLTPLTAKLHLAAEFRANVTEHPGMLPKDENTWVHERDIAGGYNGEITLQKCMGHNKVRAVKRIKNRKSETENILRELEAIANFSGSEVRKSLKQATSSTDANLPCSTSTAS